ncbi:MAG: ATP-binding protein [Bacteroidetes bacterium]|nr:ATP-binding protein [Bacteroidota bacterium]
MAHKNKILIIGFFLITTIFSFSTYWIKSLENSFADEIISNASSSFTLNLVDFLNTGKLTIEDLNQNISTNNQKVIKIDDLNTFSTKMILSSNYLKGVALSNNNFTYIIYRDKSSLVATYDVDLTDSVSSWVRMNNNLEIISEWTDIYRIFPDDQNIKEIKEELSSAKWVWKSSKDQIPELRDLLTVLFETYNSNGDSIVVGLIYSAQDISKNFASVLKFKNPLVTILTTNNNNVTPILTNDTVNISAYNSMEGDIANQIAKWKKDQNKEPHSYSFEKFNKIYWTRIVNIDPIIGINGFAVTISAADLAETERKQEILYLYLSFGLLLITIISTLLLFRKKKAVKLSSSKKEIITLSADEVLSLIKKGETEFVEFKSSLRWDYREGKVNKILENVILKSIAAFANAKGGTLFIGVSDDMEILGLENDFNTLKKRDVDYFELHLRKLINNHFGIAFSNESLSMAFPIFDEKTICIIQVQSSGKPVFLKTKNNQGNEIEKFYVRSGNASQEISSLTEINEYIKIRFDN